MAINVRHRENVVILELSGKIFGTAALEFKRVFDEQIASCVDPPKFLVDFANVTIMGSSGLGALTGAYVSVNQQGGLVALINVGTNIQNLMIRSKLVDQFEPFDSEEEAIEALNAE